MLCTLNVAQGVVLQAYRGMRHSNRASQERLRSGLFGNEALSDRRRAAHRDLNWQVVKPFRTRARNELFDLLYRKGEARWRVPIGGDEQKTRRGTNCQTRVRSQTGAR